ncbi:IS2 repressor TnpA [Klebsiella variicola]|nr:IS2 repressor TnpA [Klebsiella variicola]
MEMRLWKTFQQSMHSFSLKILYELWRQSFRMLSARSGEIAIVQQSFEPGMTVSLVARQHGVAASQLFLWRKQYQEGSLTALAAGEQVVPASELAAAMKQIKELQRLLGKKTMENELLKEAVEYGRAKKWIAHAPLLPGDGE